jgi:hypothetical protein
MGSQLLIYQKDGEKGAIWIDPTTYLWQRPEVGGQASVFAVLLWCESICRIVRLSASTRKIQKRTAKVAKAVESDVLRRDALGCLEAQGGIEPPIKVTARRPRRMPPS